MKDYRRGLLLAALCVIPIAALLLADDPYARQRERMVADQIEERGVRNRDVLRVMRATPRHLFVPLNVRAMAYADHPIPIGYEATISQPLIVGLMTELLAPAKTHRILEIGTGSGYQAAVLGQLAAKVYSIEIVPELAQSSARTLRELGYHNVTVRHGDGYRGWPEEAPFDGIMVTAAPPDLPEALVAQLAKGGRMVAPIGSAGMQELILIEKSASGAITRRSAGAVRFVPMRPAAKPR